MHVRTFSSVIPVCATCSDIQANQILEEFWTRVEMIHKQMQAAAHVCGIYQGHDGVVCESNAVTSHSGVHGVAIAAVGQNKEVKTPLG